MCMIKICSTRCMQGYGMRVFWWHSYQMWSAFEGSIPTCASFHSENILQIVAQFLLSPLTIKQGGVTTYARGVCGHGDSVTFWSA